MGEETKVHAAFPSDHQQFKFRHKLYTQNFITTDILQLICSQKQLKCSTVHHE